MSLGYSVTAPARAEVDAMPGAVVVQFGVNWCPHCQAAEPLIEEAFKDRPNVHRLKIEDGKGRSLGRSFQVKLWPTLIFLQDGNEVVRVTRPQNVEVVRQALGSLHD